MNNKLQAWLIVGALLVVVYGMNVLTERRQKQAEAEAKQVQQARQAAEAKAESRKAPAKGHGGPAAFRLPENSGPTDAPVKLEVFLDNANSCHQSSLEGIRGVKEAYGNLLRIEWCSIGDPKMSARADKLAIGCEAGLAVDGKVEHTLVRSGAKSLVKFRGPTGDKYRVEDVYAAINQELTMRGCKPPAKALAQARAISNRRH